MSKAKITIIGNRSKAIPQCCGSVNNQDPFMHLELAIFEEYIPPVTMIDGEVVIYGEINIEKTIKQF
jgi:hypothetical protein